jgi:hypothetical protein
MVEILESNKFGKIKIDDIIQFESNNEIEFPVDFKDFLITNNGGKPKQNLVPSVNSDVQWIFGMVDEPYYASLFQHIDMFYKRIPSWYFPIANDSGGNLYLMSLHIENHGLIAFWKHEEETDGNAEQYFENMSFVSNSFTDFLNQLTSKL